MKARIELWGGQIREMSLGEALTPSPDYDGGVAERALSNSTKALESVGRLAALLVEKGFITVGEAKDAMGIYSKIEVIP